MEEIQKQKIIVNGCFSYADLKSRVGELRFRDSKKFVSISRTNVRFFLLCTQHFLDSMMVITNSSMTVFKKKSGGGREGGRGKRRRK